MDVLLIKPYLLCSFSLSLSLSLSCYLSLSLSSANLSLLMSLQIWSFTSTDPSAKEFISGITSSTSAPYNGVLIPGRSVGARVLVPELRQGPERGVTGVQVVVRDREVVPTADIRRQLLRHQPQHHDPPLPGGPIDRAQGKAPFRRLQSRAGGVGRLRVPVDCGHVPSLPLARGD